MQSSAFCATASNVSCIADEFLARASESLGQACRAKLGTEGSFADFEAVLYECANETVRRQIEARLKQIEEAHTDQVIVDGKRFRRHQPGAVEYHTLVGQVRVERWTYREIGVRNGPTIVPLDLAAGLIHRSTPALAYSIAHGFAAGPTRGVLRTTCARPHQP
jgi:hypothetical protein